MTITLKISENTKEKMKEFYQDSMRPKTPPYAVFQADSEDTVVTLYESGKAVFQGISADIDAAMWRQVEKNLNPLKNQQIHLYLYHQVVVLYLKCQELNENNHPLTLEGRMLYE